MSLITLNYITMLKLHIRVTVKLQFNNRMCNIMMYCKIRNVLICSYEIYDVTIRRGTLINDLGSVSDSGFTFVTLGDFVTSIFPLLLNC